MRPASEIVNLLRDSKSQVFFCLNKQEVNAKSLIGLLSLTAEKGAKIDVRIEGEDAFETLEKLILVFERQF
jgi:phosphocarrier protein